MTEKELLEKCLKTIRFYNDATGQNYVKAQTLLSELQKELEEFFRTKEEQKNLTDYMF